MSIKIKLPFSVFIEHRFVTTGTEVYVLPIKDHVLRHTKSLTVRTFNLPTPGRCVICLTEDEANFIQIKHPQLFN